MTLKYESELLFDLMKRDGDDAPSDVLPYESELKEKYLNQVVGAYPKLQDYQPEWLNYNLYCHLPSDFPVESVANVTSASFNNVVPYAYGSAILKGNSEVVAGKNKCNMEKIELGWIHGETGTVSGDNGVFIPVEVSGTITISNYVHTDIRYVYEYDANGKYLVRTQVTTDIVTLDLTQNTTLIKIGFYNGTLSTVKSLELQVEQGEIATEYEPYNPTLVSVKMPVLTTTGKNLIDYKKFQTRMNATITDLQENSITFDTKDVWAGLVQDVTLIPNTQYTLSCITSTNIINPYIRHVLVGGGFTGAEGGINAFSFTTNETGKISISFENGDMENPNKTGLTVSNIQLEKGSTATSYEPYKSNILTVNEDVTLRSNGDVYDELNLLTGRLTQRIDENNEVLAQEVVKTVDLSCINEQGESETFRPIEGTMHVSTSSQTLPPLLDMSVPVEATTQNLMSFANIVEEEE